MYTHTLKKSAEYQDKNMTKQISIPRPTPQSCSSPGTTSKAENSDFGPTSVKYNFSFS